MSDNAASHQRPSFGVTAIGAVQRLGMADGTTTELGEYFDPFAESIIGIYPEWTDGLTGIEEFSHLAVVLYMDRATPLEDGEPLRRRIESLDGMPEIGVFGTRSPRRPNPIGLCCPRLLRRDGNLLHVTGLDAWPGTPLLDLKGYYVRDELQPTATTPDWLRRLWAIHDATRGADHRSLGGSTGYQEGACAG